MDHVGERTVTCLYSAERATRVTGVPHLLQNIASGDSCVPQEEHDSPVVVTPPHWVHVNMVSPDLVMSVLSISHLPRWMFETRWRMGGGSSLHTMDRIWQWAWDRYGRGTCG